MESDPLELQNKQRGKQPQLLIKQIRLSKDVECRNWIKDSKYQSCQEMEADSLEEPKTTLFSKCPGSLIRDPDQCRSLELSALMEMFCISAVPWQPLATSDH